MSNENNDLVIFEYTAFKKRLLKAFLDAHTHETILKSLQENFRKELDYIGKGDETDNIFRDVKEISKGIIPEIQKRLGSIVGNERFHKELNDYEKMLEQDIKDFIFKAQSNIDRQIKAVLDGLEEEFLNHLESEIRPKLRQVAPYLHLFVNDDQDPKGVREAIKNWQKQTENFLDDAFALPKDVLASAEKIREDLKCLEALENAKIDSAEEVEALKHLFGAYGTDILSRVNYESEDLDLRIFEEVQKVSQHMVEIYNCYQWETKANGARPTELIGIYKHANTRLNDIRDFLETLVEKNVSLEIN